MISLIRNRVPDKGFFLPDRFPSPVKLCGYACENTQLH